MFKFVIPVYIGNVLLDLNTTNVVKNIFNFINRRHAKKNNTRSSKSDDTAKTNLNFERKI